MFHNILFRFIFIIFLILDKIDMLMMNLVVFILSIITYLDIFLQSFLSLDGIYDNKNKQFHIGDDLDVSFNRNYMVVIFDNYSDY